MTRASVGAACAVALGVSKAVDSANTVAIFRQIRIPLAGFPPNIPSSS